MFKYDILKILLFALNWLFHRTKDWFGFINYHTSIFLSSSYWFLIITYVSKLIREEVYFCIGIWMLSYFRLTICPSIDTKLPIIQTIISTGFPLFIISTFTPGYYPSGCICSANVYVIYSSPHQTLCYILFLTIFIKINCIIQISYRFFIICFTLSPSITEYILMLKRKSMNFDRKYTF